MSINAPSEVVRAIVKEEIDRLTMEHAQAVQEVPLDDMSPEAARVREARTDRIVQLRKLLEQLESKPAL